MYMRTLGEQNEQRVYGIDLATYDRGNYAVQLSRPNMTNDFEALSEINKFANQLDLPPSLIDEFLYIML